MGFEWDSRKSLGNKEKHGIDFETAKALWLDEQRVEIEMTFPDEKGWALIARLKGRLGRQSIPYVMRRYDSSR